MDSFLPSSSQSTPQPQHEDSHTTEASHQDPLGEQSSVNMSEVPEQHTSPSLDDMSRRVQELVEKINDSRNSDQKVLEGFEEKLVKKVTDMCQQMKEHMYTVYEDNSNDIQVKLQELSEVLYSCSKLSSEILEASQALETLRMDLAITPNSGTLTNACVFPD